MPKINLDVSKTSYSIVKLSAMSAWTTSCFLVISFNEVASSICVLVFATTDAILSWSLRCLASPLQTQRLLAYSLAPRSRRRSILLCPKELSPYHQRRQPSQPSSQYCWWQPPDHAVTTEITLATFAFAFAMPAEPSATKLVFKISAPWWTGQGPLRLVLLPLRLLR